MKAKFSSSSHFFFFNFGHFSAYCSPHQSSRDWSGEDWNASASYSYSRNNQQQHGREQHPDRMKLQLCDKAKTCDKKYNNAALQWRPGASHSPDIRKHGGWGQNRANVTLHLWHFFFYFFCENENYVLNMYLFKAVALSTLAVPGSLHLSLLSMNSWDQLKLSHKMSFEPNNSCNKSKVWSGVL